MPKHGVPGWGAAQSYIEALFAPQDVPLKDALRRSARAGLPPIAVSPSGGRLLQVLARAARARRILEVGTLGGYSAIWLARALPRGGRLVSLELHQEHADTARRNLDRAGLGKRVEVRTGPALQAMRRMVRDRVPAFDLVFIDADKDEYPGYLRLAYRLTRSGGLIVADNALRRAVSPGAPKRGGVLECNRIAARHTGLVSIIVPVLGKGVDGMLVCVKTGR
ncbi:MAG: O-methyltransferase [Candidatus Edwardsbacteria bacterium]|nr:O-methyltransferase [Candidatus Edwardsbacteria bacterium]